MKFQPAPNALLPLAAALLASSATGQTAPEPAPPSQPPAAAQQVEVTGGRESDADQRRQSTTAKIVIGREEIDRMGDSTLGEVLKRLPGVTMPGPPGRGGPPRMRGLGAGYTQILIDGQRAPPGFSIESLTPDQVERIEILRAPTAETGARAIGGTINIITREGFKRRLNDLRLGTAYENGRYTPGLSWTYNDSAGELIYNLSASAFRNHRDSASSTRTTDEDLASGELVQDRVETSRGEDRRVGVNLTSRLQWRLGPGDSLTLTPVVFHTQAEGQRLYGLTQAFGVDAPLYDNARSDTDSHFTVGRLNGQWRQGLGSGLRLELNGGASLARGASTTTRLEFDDGGTLLRTLFDDSRSRERTGSLSGKLSAGVGDEHSLVIGTEAESQQRSETRISLQNGLPVLADFGDDIEASSLRMALYAQDEWSLSKTWSAHAGLRWEGIRTTGDTGDGTRPHNSSSVFTPLFHAVWKPDPNVRDQLRISLTRSYKSPTLQNLIARPSIASRWPVAGANVATSPDRAGNPGLRPELATGIDVAFERYLKDGGVLSANVFVRKLKDYIRNVTTLEDVAWSPVPRYVQRPQNVGGALTAGIEMDAKFRLDQALQGAWPVEMRANLSLFKSRVDQVPGPDNRLDQQPPGTANIGADYRIRGTPLTLGGSLNWTPGYRTQISTEQAAEVAVKRQFDAYALWVFGPAAQLRLLASNLAPSDYVGSGILDTAGLRERARTTTETYVNWQLRLEMKL